MKVNGIRREMNGWIYLSIYGSPYKLGFANGYLCSKEIKEAMEMLTFYLYDSYGHHFDFFLELANDFFKPHIEKNHPEYLLEMQGITDGANAGGAKVTLLHIIFWNCWFSFDYLYSKIPTIIELAEFSHIKDKYKKLLGSHSSAGAHEGGGDRCSAFMAVGDWTKDGKIVCAHNTFDNFINGQYTFVVIDLKPSNGHRILMQSFPGGIFSGTDVFVTSKGIFGTETTLGGFNEYANRDPICVRMRKAMQYGNTLDDYVDILTTNNSGDYANSYLLGDTNTNEIMRIELGLNYYNVERTKNGYFIGFNAAYDPRIRNLECVNSGWDDIRRHQGARRVRLTQLMNEYKGHLDCENAKIIIADHYDVYLNKINPCSRTTCSHYELDAREYMSQADRPKPYQPRGALDGMVVDSNTAKRMEFWGRWGSSCGTPFYKDEFCDRNMIWDVYRPYLHDRPTQPWTLFGIKGGSKNKTKRNNKKNKTTLKK